MARLTLSALFFSTLASALPQAQPTPPQALFLPAPQDAAAILEPDPTFATDALVAVRTELFAEKQVDAAHPLILSLGLEAGLSELARFETRSVLASGAVVLQGRLQNAAQSQVIFVQRGDLITGTVRDGARLYKLNWAGAGWHRIARVDESLFPPCGTGPTHHVADHDAPPPAPAGGYLVNPNPTIDIMVVYTPLAGANVGGTVAMENLIDLAVLETNQAYINSQVTQRLRLVHQQELAAYTENGDFNIELNRLTNTSDGHIDNVHALRNQYGADEVAMIVDSNQYCGIAWLMTNLSTSFATSAFSVTSKQCATGYYSFGHELGHNMASHHDHANAGGALYPYSYGHRTASGSYRTIMAYAPGTRIQYFSNPNVTYLGEALGVPEGQADAAENWKSLNNTATTVAQFRCAIPEPFGTGKVTSIGTTPSLGWSGSPSVLANNFHVLVSGSMPGKVGLIFWGTQPNDVPFMGGTMWAGGVIKRLPGIVNNGSGAADFPFPLNQLVAGDVAYAQHWGRDPQHPDGFKVSLSNGLRIDVCP